MPYIYDNEKEIKVEAEIVLIKNHKLPLKKNGWNFNWNALKKEENTNIYALSIADNGKSVEGMLLLKVEEEMLIMELLEIAPYNIGSKNRRYEGVAGCLIAFACRESFKIEGNYQGYLTFVSKTNLIQTYEDSYGAVLTSNRRMYIDDINGRKLIDKYLA